jgi:catechol 2,3-dioxygenase-like lactoylglutathione lyase family enzyme
MKTHLNLATIDLARSVEFYSILLDMKPQKVRADYALFVAEQPPLELALDVADSVAPVGNTHFGIFMETAEELERAIVRLRRAGLAASIEREQTCCYANQTKVWAVDPAGRRWELYTVHEETAERDSGSTCCA